MNTQIVAILIQEGSKFISQILKTRPTKKPDTDEQPPMAVVPKEVKELIIEGKSNDVATGCVPCSIGHLGTCSGLLNEAMRFAKKDGIASDEVINRISACIDEISALERIDLRPEMIVTLPAWEKQLADKALIESRNIRHGLEEVSTVDELERLAAITQTSRKEIGISWFKQRLAHMPESKKKELAEKAIDKLLEE